MNGNLAREIIANRPYYSFNELKTKNPTLKDDIIKQIKKQGYSFSTKQSGKKPIWYPRPQSKIDLSTGRTHLIVSEPRSEMTFGFDIQDERIPMMHISSKDDSVELFTENHSPIFRIKISGGRMEWTSDGVKIRKGKKSLSYDWKKDKKKIARLITRLTIKYKKYQKAALTLGVGLKTAISATRGIGASIGSEGLVVDSNVQRISVNSSECTHSSICDPCNPNILENGMTEVILPDSGNCTLFGTATSYVEDLLESSKKIVNCSFVTVLEIVEECIDPMYACLESSNEAYLSCISDCDSRYDNLNKWKRPACYLDCLVKSDLDSLVCLMPHMICTIVETQQKVWECITKQGPVYDEPSQTGDIRVYESVGPIGIVIDYATCGYGYSHAALVCDDGMIHATGENGMVNTPTDFYGDRKFVTLRLNLTDAKKRDLCECMRTMLESNTDYDYLESITFGTIDDPGKEICTMSIMHCLDSIGFDRSSLGLDGFVSPNELTRVLGAPNSRDL